MNKGLSTILIIILVIILTTVIAGTIGYYSGTTKREADNTIVPTGVVAPTEPAYAIVTATMTPTNRPTWGPTIKPSVIPTIIKLTSTPTAKPTSKPTAKPTVRPTSTPTTRPTATPTATATPTPREVVNGSFYCGSYSQGSYPPLPATGVATLFTSLYPSGGVSTGTSMDGFQWDYDGDGTWDSAIINDQANRTYQNVGTYRPSFRVHATNGDYGPTCRYPFEVTVRPNVDFQNEWISIDRLQGEVTVSRSRENYQFPTEEASLANGGSRIYIPFMTISSKEKFTSIRIPTAYNTMYGFYEIGYQLREGTAYRQHLFIDKSKPNGVYTGEFKITYTTDNGTVTREAATAKYKITLID